jgi:hypothetical protein
MERRVFITLLDAAARPLSARAQQGVRCGASVYWRTPPPESRKRKAGWRHSSRGDAGVRLERRTVSFTALTNVPPTGLGNS